MSSTVVLGSVEMTSTSQSAKDMASVLAPVEEKAVKPRILRDKGVDQDEPVEEKDETSQAASVLGKKGGEAAAKARRAAEKEAAKVAKDAKEGQDEAKATKPGRAKFEDDEEAVAVDEEAEAEKPAAKPRHDLQARVQQLAEQRRQEKERADRAERELAETRRARTEPAREERRPEPVANPAATAAKPMPADFKTYEEYLDARDVHNRQSWEAEQRQRADVQREKERVGGILKSYSEAMKKALASDPDFWDNLSPEVASLESSLKVAQPGPKNWLADEIVLNPDHAARIKVHLSENPDEFQRIAALSSPRETTREIAILVTRLDAVTADTSSEPEVSKAKPPARSVAASPHIGSSGELGDDAPLSAFVQRFGQRELRSGR